jgi:hypothetical protein
MLRALTWSATDRVPLGKVPWPLSSLPSELSKSVSVSSAWLPLLVSSLPGPPVHGDCVLRAAYCISKARAVPQLFFFPFVLPHFPRPTTTTTVATNNKQRLQSTRREGRSALSPKSTGALNWGGVDFGTFLSLPHLLLTASSSVPILLLSHSHSHAHAHALHSHTHTHTHSHSHCHHSPSLSLSFFSLWSGILFAPKKRNWGPGNHVVLHGIKPNSFILSPCPSKGRRRLACLVLSGRKIIIRSTSARSRLRSPSIHIPSGTPVSPKPF